jgi:hypothetical protein
MQLQSPNDQLSGTATAQWLVLFNTVFYHLLSVSVPALYLIFYYPDMNTQLLDYLLFRFQENKEGYGDLW